MQHHNNFVAEYDRAEEVIHNTWFDFAEFVKPGEFKYEEFVAKHKQQYDESGKFQVCLIHSQFK